MSNGEVIVTLVGSTGGPAELRFTPAGVAVCNFSIAVTARKFDKLKQEWVDQATTWYRCAAWREQAESVAESLDQKGMRVIVVGSLNPREYEKDGVKRMSLEVDVEEVGPALKYATARVNRTQRGGGGGGAWAETQKPGQPAGDPWATAAPTSAGAGQEPPF